MALTQHIRKMLAREDWVNSYQGGIGNRPVMARWGGALALKRLRLPPLPA